MNKVIIAFALLPLLSMASPFEPILECHDFVIDKDLSDSPEFFGYQAVFRGDLAHELKNNGFRLNNKDEYLIRGLRKLNGQFKTTAAEVTTSWFKRVDKDKFQFHYRQGEGGSVDLFDCQILDTIEF